MENNRDIYPVGAITNVLRIKPIGKVRVFKRPEYMYKQNKQGRRPPVEINSNEEPGKEMNGVNCDAKGIGKNIDFKV